MKTTKRFKELYVDVFVKIMQIIFAALVIGPIVSGFFDLTKFLTGSIACVLCIIIASIIASKITTKEEEE